MREFDLDENRYSENGIFRFCGGLIPLNCVHERVKTALVDNY